MIKQISTGLHTIAQYQIENPAVRSQLEAGYCASADSRAPSKG